MMPTFDEHMKAIQESLAANGGQAYPGLLRVATPLADPRTGQPMIVNVDYRGKSLRADIATAALQGLADRVPAGLNPNDDMKYEESKQRWIRARVKDAVLIADELIAALAPPPAPEPPKAEEPPTSNILIAE